MIFLGIEWKPMHMILTHKQKQRLICVRVVLLKQRVTLKSSGNSIKTEMSHSNQNQDFAIVRCIKMTLGCLKIPKKAKRWFLGIAKFRRWSPNRFTISRYHYRYTPNRYPLFSHVENAFHFEVKMLRRGEWNDDLSFLKQNF